MILAIGLFFYLLIGFGVAGAVVVFNEKSGFDMSILVIGFLLTMFLWPSALSSLITTVLLINKDKE
jgi:hypothetical protein